MRWIVLCYILAVYLCGCGKDAAAPPADNPSYTVTTTTTAVTTTNTKPSSSSHTGTTADTSVTSTDNQSTLAALDTTTKNKATETTTTLDRTTMSSAAITTRSTDAIVTTTGSAATTTPPQRIIFTATVRDNKQQPVGGITVTVYTNASVGEAVTDSNGVAHVQLLPDDAYRVVLTNLPSGYAAASEYRFTSTKVNISIQKSAIQNDADHSDAGYDIGMSMGNFTLTDAYGNTYRFSELKADKKLIVLNFWYVECTFCVAEFPAFETAVKTYGDDVILLAVTPYDQDSDIRLFHQQYQAETGIRLTFPLLRDTCNLTKGFEVTGFPTTVFITADGVIRNIHMGYYPDSETLCAEIGQYLN